MEEFLQVKAHLLNCQTKIIGRKIRSLKSPVSKRTKNKCQEAFPKNLIASPKKKSQITPLLKISFQKVRLIPLKISEQQLLLSGKKRKKIKSPIWSRPMAIFWSWIQQGSFVMRVKPVELSPRSKFIHLIMGTKLQKIMRLNLINLTILSPESSQTQETYNSKITPAWF